MQKVKLRKNDKNELKRLKGYHNSATYKDLTSKFTQYVKLNVL